MQLIETLVSKLLGMKVVADEHAASSVRANEGLWEMVVLGTMSKVVLECALPVVRTSIWSGIGVSFGGRSWVC